MHARFSARKKKEREGLGQELEERKWTLLERRSALSLVGYLLHRDIGIIAPWAGDRSANGTGCFALVETYDKSRKLNHRYRLSIVVRHEQRTNCRGYKAR